MHAMLLKSIYSEAQEPDYINLFIYLFTNVLFYFTS